MDDQYDIALCHALGQGCSSVHVETHAIGLVFYELTAIVIAHQYHDYEQSMIEKIHDYESRLLWWQEHAKEYIHSQTWATFLIRKDKVNKEKLLYEKRG